MAVKSVKRLSEVTAMTCPDAALPGGEAEARVVRRNSRRCTPPGYGVTVSVTALLTPNTHA